MRLLKREFDRRGITPTGASKRTGISQPEIQRWYVGDRPISKRGAIVLAPLIGRTPEELLFQERSVRIVGKVGAGAEAHYYSGMEEFLGLARFPQNGSETTVAVEIDGDSLGAGYHGWIAYYDDRREPPTEDLLGKPCVVELQNGKVLVKILARGRQPDRYDLFAVASGTALTDQTVVWAARVISMAPPDLAVIEETQEQPQPPQKRQGREKKRAMATRGGGR